MQLLEHVQVAAGEVPDGQLTSCQRFLRGRAMTEAPFIYVATTDPCRRPIAFVVSERDACKHDETKPVGACNHWCLECGALGSYRLGAGKFEVCWQTPERAR